MIVVCIMYISASIMEIGEGKGNVQYRISWRINAVRSRINCSVGIDIFRFLEFAMRLS